MNAFPLTKPREGAGSTHQLVPSRQANSQNVSRDEQPPGQGWSAQGEAGHRLLSPPGRQGLSGMGLPFLTFARGIFLQMRVPSLKGAEITPRFLLPLRGNILGLTLPQKQLPNSSICSQKRDLSSALLQGMVREMTAFPHPVARFSS